MNSTKLIQDPEVRTKYLSYPLNIRKKIRHLRSLILTAADTCQDVDHVHETLKWGQPSFLTKTGSTIRIDWKESDPGKYAIFFKCTSKLIPTIREVYGDLFTYEKNRALIFDLNRPIPEAEIMECIQMALTYHKVKHEPLLGRSVSQDLTSTRTSTE